MSIYSLNIYGENDEILKTYETDRVRWGLFVEAVKVQDELDEMDIGEQFDTVGVFVKQIFPGLTNEELLLADAGDVFSTFSQLVNNAQKITGGKKSKNLKAAGA